MEYVAKNGPQIRRVCNEVRGFFTWGYKRPKWAYRLFISIVTAPGMGWCCDSLPSWSAPFFWRIGVCSVITPLEDTTRNTYSKEGSKVYELPIRTLLSSPQQGSRTRVPDTELEWSDDYKNTRYEFQKVQANSFCLFTSRFIQIA